MLAVTPSYQITRQLPVAFKLPSRAFNSVSLNFSTTFTFMMPSCAAVCRGVPDGSSTYGPMDLWDGWSVMAARLHHRSSRRRSIPGLEAAIRAFCSMVGFMVIRPSRMLSLSSWDWGLLVGLCFAKIPWNQLVDHWCAWEPTSLEMLHLWRFQGFIHILATMNMPHQPVHSSERTHLSYHVVGMRIRVPWLHLRGFGYSSLLSSLRLSISSCQGFCSQAALQMPNSKMSPFFNSMGSAANSPTRNLGPCRSPRHSTCSSLWKNWKAWKAGNMSASVGNN